MKLLMRSPSRRVRTAVLVLAVVLGFATGCTVSGNPEPQYPDPKSLDSGQYSVEPLDMPAGNEKYGRVVESGRMAEIMVDPVEVEPTLAFTVNAFGILPLPTPAKARHLLAEQAETVLEREGMLAGCAVAGTDLKGGSPEVGKARVLTVIVLRFPDAEAARRAARDIDAVDKAVNPENVSVPIPDYPDAHAHWRPNVPTMAATIAHDSYVVSLLIGHTSPDLDALTGLARAAFTRQSSRLAGFSPTPADRIASLPLDQDGMIRRMVPAAPDRWPYPAVVVSTVQRAAAWNSRVITSGVVFGPRGAALFIGGRSARRPADSIAVNTSNILVRYATVVTARVAFIDSVRGMALDTDLRPSAAPAGVPDVVCFDNPTTPALRFTCRQLVGRYMATISGRDQSTTQRKVVAQYGLLVNGGQ